MILWLILALITVVADQVTKYLVVTNIGGSDTITAIPGILDFVYVKNTGAAFSLFSNSVEILSVISSIFCIGVVVYMITQKPQNKILVTSLGLLFGGAAGNVIDRIWRGYVVDFLETAFMRFPVFNIADVAITAGAVLLVIYFIFFDKKETERMAEEAAGADEGEEDGEADFNSDGQ